MEQKKLNFSEITVRITKTPEAERFAKAFAECPTSFASTKSAFIRNLAGIGLNVYLGENKPKEETSSKEVIACFNALDKTLEAVIKNMMLLNEQNKYVCEAMTMLFKFVSEELEEDDDIKNIVDELEAHFLKPKKTA